jgi:hydrogenase maturation factor HypF (carbamoyltransferase family)
VSDILEGIPLFCPVCDVSMTDKDDDAYFRTLSCCKNCGMTWAEVNREKWLSGWRPAVDLVQQELNSRRTHILSA